MQDVSQQFSTAQVDSLRGHLEQYRQTYPSNQHGFFLIRQHDLAVARLQDWETIYAGCNDDQVNMVT